MVVHLVAPIYMVRKSVPLCDLTETVSGRGRITCPASIRFSPVFRRWIHDGSKWTRSLSNHSGVFVNMFMFTDQVIFGRTLWTLGSRSLSTAILPCFGAFSAILSLFCFFLLISPLVRAFFHRSAGAPHGADLRAVCGRFHRTRPAVCRGFQRHQPRCESM
jgi:hypothetical protein